MIGRRSKNIMIVLHVQERLSLERVPRKLYEDDKSQRETIILSLLNSLAINPVRAALSQFF